MTAEVFQGGINVASLINGQKLTISNSGNAGVFIISGDGVGKGFNYIYNTHDRFKEEPTHVEPRNGISLDGLLIIAT